MGSHTYIIETGPLCFFNYSISHNQGASLRANFTMMLYHGKKSLTEKVWHPETLRPNSHRMKWAEHSPANAKYVGPHSFSKYVWEAYYMPSIIVRTQVTFMKRKHREPCPCEVWERSKLYYRKWLVLQKQREENIEHSSKNTMTECF